MRDHPAVPDAVETLLHDTRHGPRGYAPHLADARRHRASRTIYRHLPMSLRPMAFDEQARTQASNAQTAALTESGAMNMSVMEADVYV